MRPVVAAVVATVVAGTTIGGACSREPAFEDRTARVTVDGQTTTFAIDGCLLDGTTVYLVGREDGGEVLQAVVGVEADGETGVPDSTGLTVTEGAVPIAAFGEEAWRRRGEDGAAPGRVDAARVRGSADLRLGPGRPHRPAGRSPACARRRALRPRRPVRCPRRRLIGWAAGSLRRR